MKSVIEVFYFDFEKCLYLIINKITNISLNACTALLAKWIINEMEAQVQHDLLDLIQQLINLQIFIFKKLIEFEILIMYKVNEN